MLAQGLEVVIGCDGADTITMGGGEDILFAAGGGGSDRFIISCDEVENLRVIWGGDGADTFVFSDNLGGGIAVVRINDLTEEMFASLTVEDLGLGNLSLGVFRAIIINPDGSDRVRLDGQVYSASGMPDGIQWKSLISTNTTDLIGRPLAVQGAFAENYEFEATLDVERDAYENVLSIIEYTGRWLSDGTEEFILYEYDPEDQDKQDEAEAFIEARIIQPVFRMTDLEPSPGYGQLYSDFFVVGGGFSGASLYDSGTLTAPTPEDPGITPFDWLLVA